MNSSSGTGAGNSAPHGESGTTPAAAASGGGGSEDRSDEVTLTAIREFEAALARLDTDERHRPAQIRALMRDAIESQLEDLRAHLAGLAAGRVPPA